MGLLPQLYQLLIRQLSNAFDLSLRHNTRKEETEQRLRKQREERDRKIEYLKDMRENYEKVIDKQDSEIVRLKKELQAKKERERQERMLAEAKSKEDARLKSEKLSIS